VTRYDVGNRLGLLSSEESKAGRFAYFGSRATARTEPRPTNFARPAKLPSPYNFAHPTKLPSPCHIPIGTLTRGGLASPL
jgi:hypothetical protein